MTPPSALSLPSPSVIYLPGRNGKRIKRTATWRWEEPEWGVVVNKDGTGVKRVEKNPPGIGEEEEAKDGNSTIKRAASILRERSMAASEKEKEAGAIANVPEAEETATDADGWVYGDNKWEASTSKGGLGKYTRYRRWTRVAILEETVQEVGPGGLGVVVKDSQGVLKKRQSSIPEAPAVVTDAVALADLKSTVTRTSPERGGHSRTASRSGDSSPMSDIPRLSQESSPSVTQALQGNAAQDNNSSPLRERLKTAIKKAR